MKIKAYLGVSESYSDQIFDLDDLNLTKEQWDSMNDEQRKEAIQDAINDLLEQPYWMLNTFIIRDSE